MQPATVVPTLDLCTSYPLITYGWIVQGSVEYEDCRTFLHKTSGGNRTQDILTLRRFLLVMSHPLFQGLLARGGVGVGCCFVKLRVQGMKRTESTRVPGKGHNTSR